MPSRRGARSLEGKKAERRIEVAYWIGLTALVAACGWARSVGLDPHTLWYDDLWVAALTGVPLGVALTAPVAAAPGFLLVTWWAQRLGSDPELSLQVAPFVASLAVIPVAAMLVRRVTDSRAVAVAAASLLVFSPSLTHYAVFVKQYTLEALGVTLCLLLATRFLERPTRGALAAFVAAAAATSFVGIGSVVVAVIVVNVVLGWQAYSSWRADEHQVARRLALVAAVCDLAAWRYYLFLAPRHGSGLENYWSPYYVPTESLARAWEFLRETGIGAVRDPLPEAAPWLLWLALPGMLWLALRRDCRPLAASMALLTAAMLVLSARSQYPVGGGRTDIFFFPVVAVLVGSGLAAVTRFVPGRRALRWLVAGVAVVLALGWAPGKEYFDLDLSRYARILGERARPAHAVIIYPQASTLAAYYSGFGSTLTATGDGGAYFDIGHPGALTLPHDDAELGRRQLADYLLRTEAPRLWLLVTRENGGNPVADLHEIIVSGGYRQRQEWTSRIRTRLVLYERAGAPVIGGQEDPGDAVEGAP